VDTSAILEDNKEKKIERTKNWPPPKKKHDPKKPVETKQRKGHEIKERLANTTHVEVGNEFVPIDNRYLDYQEP
jgi:hypothetical protein